MASTVATHDVQGRVSVKTAAGTVHLLAHQAQSQHIPTIEVVKQYSAQTTGTWSSYSEFSLTADQLPNVVDSVTVVLALSAASKTGGTYIGLVGDANFLFKSIEIYSGANLLSTLYAENGFIQELAHYTDEYKAKMLPAMGNATQTNRRTAATSAQTLYLNLPIPWLLKKTGWLSAQAAGALRFRLYHQDLSTVISTDGTAPAMAINSVTMNVAGRMYTNQASVGALITTQRKLGIVSERFWNPIQQQVVLPSGSTSYTLQLTNFVGNYSHIWMIIRTQASVGTPLGNTPQAFLPCATYAMNDSAGNVLIPTLPSGYAEGVLLGRYATGDFTDIDGGLGPSGTAKTVYPMIFASDPEKALFDGVSNGFLRLDGLSKVTVTFASSLSAANVVDFIGYCASQLNSDATGAVRSVLVQ